jgi:hypothetical protein
MIPREVILEEVCKILGAMAYAETVEHFDHYANNTTDRIMQRIEEYSHDPTQFNGRLAPRENVKKYKKEIRQILSIIGKPDIWVTDNTTLGSLGLENEVVGELAKFIYNPSGDKDTPLLLHEAPIWQFARDLRED